MKKFVLSVIFGFGFLCILTQGDMLKVFSSTSSMKEKGEIRLTSEVSQKKNQITQEKETQQNNSSVDLVAPNFPPSRTFNTSIAELREINSIVGLPEMLYYWSGEKNADALIEKIYSYSISQGIQPMAYFYGGLVESRWQANCGTQKTQDGSEPFAFGVYQATPDNRVTMGVDVEELRKLDAISQIEKFRKLDDHKFGYLYKQGNVADLQARKSNPIEYITYRLIVMQPAVLDEYRNEDFDHIVFKAGSNALERNPGCDPKGKGSVNLREFIKFHEEAKKSSLREIPLYAMFGKIKHWKRGVRNILVYDDELKYFIKWIEVKINEGEKSIKKIPSAYLEYYYAYKK